MSRACDEEGRGNIGRVRIRGVYRAPSQSVVKVAEFVSGGGQFGW